MKKIIKNSIKIYIGFVIGIFISILMINADNSLNASSINIDKTNMPNISGTTLNSALDYLYERASHVGECPSGYTCEYDFGGMFVYETAEKTYEHIVYMDPTDLSRMCYDLNSDSTTGTKTGCMKWYIYGRDSDGNYLAILDHNTTERQAWNTDKNVTEYGTNVAYEQSLVYPVVQSLVSESNWNSILNPRLISAYEVANIVGYENFTNTSGWFYLDSKNQSDYPNYQGGSSYAWLFDNLGWTDLTCTSYGCNTTNTTNSAGYWTSTSYGITGTGSLVWHVNRLGALIGNHAYVTDYGIRPVVTIPKNIKRRVSMMYLNPQDLSASCDEFNSTSNVEQKDNCMKWYIYEETGDKYYAILDHNTTERQAWNTDTNVTQYGTNVPYEQSLVYPVIQLLTKTTEEDANGSNWDTSLSPRLISAYEVAEITGKEGFTNTSGWFYLDTKNQVDSTRPRGQGTSNYAWLSDNLGWNDSNGDCTNFGCNYSNTKNSAGYWTSTPYGTAGAGSIVWYVSRVGGLGSDYAYFTYDGVRPVIEIPKTVFE